MIGLIQHEQRAGRNVVDQILHDAGLPAGAHGIIRIGKINQAGIFFLCKVQQGRRILVVIHIRRGDEPAAETRDMKIIGGIGAKGICHRYAGFHKKPDGQAQQAIDAFANRDILNADPMMPGNRGAEIMDFRVAIFPRLEGCLLHGGNGLGRGAENTFIGADAGAKRNAASPQDGFRANKGNGGGKAFDERGKAGHGAILLIKVGASDIIGWDKSMCRGCIAAAHFIDRGIGGHV